MIINDPSRAGQLATAKEIFGEFSQYAVYAVHTRSLVKMPWDVDRVQWFVVDVERCDEFGLPLVIRQGTTRDEVMRGF
jgi:hypothetical protein